MMSQAKVNARVMAEELKSQSGANYGYHENVNDMAHLAILELLLEVQNDLATLRTQT